MSAAADLPIIEDEDSEARRKKAQFWSNLFLGAVILLIVFLLFRRVLPGGAGYR
jgi:hypothetical protein